MDFSAVEMGWVDVESVLVRVWTIPDRASWTLAWRVTDMAVRQDRTDSVESDSVWEFNNCSSTDRSPSCSEMNRFESESKAIASKTLADAIFESELPTPRIIRMDDKRSWLLLIINPCICSLIPFSSLTISKILTANSKTSIPAPALSRTPVTAGTQPSKLATSLLFSSEPDAKSRISVRAPNRRFSTSATQALTWWDETAGEGTVEDWAQPWMRRWRVRLGTKSLEGRTCMVAGQVLLPLSSHVWMLERS